MSNTYTRWLLESKIELTLTDPLDYLIFSIKYTDKGKYFLYVLTKFRMTFKELRLLITGDYYVIPVNLPHSLFRKLLKEKYKGVEETYTEPLNKLPE